MESLASKDVHCDPLYKLGALFFQTRYLNRFLLESGWIPISNSKWLFNSILLGFGQPAQYLSYVYIWYFSYVSIYKDTHTFRTYVWPVVSVGRTVLRAVFTLHLPFNRRQNSTVCGHWTCFPHNPGRSTCLIERTWILFSNFGSGNCPCRTLFHFYWINPRCRTPLADVYCREEWTWTSWTSLVKIPSRIGLCTSKPRWRCY